jgi:molybdenum-dependent DNA-binding transcriptional regulator ModE
MAGKNKPKMLSRREGDLLEALQDTVTLKDAANKIGLAAKTAYNMVARLRRKYYEARHFTNWYDAQKKRSERMRMVLTDRTRERELGKEQAEKVKAYVQNAESSEIPSVKDRTEFTEDQTEEKWQEA